MRYATSNFKLTKLKVLKTYAKWGHSEFQIGTKISYIFSSIKGKL